ncbi:hypothetical protein, variant [Puccinia striiformis f. sp. tritici PST-78]|uniref:SEC7 domain-containing protein n=1 Tax=Puccinia striiformis f. sp. tritici PST-78 TaxID=1165861 RepID=A0A0L0UTT4_9BASI|nr:hypothetical protein, variant [Puccinia striiformis f. sp. tritici PST-78]
MRKRSGFFRRKLNTSQSQADPNYEELPTAPSHIKSLDLAFSPTLSEQQGTHRRPLTDDQQNRDLNPTPPVPSIPLSFHPNNAGAQSDQPPPMPLKSRISSNGSRRHSPSSLDREDPQAEPSTPTNSKSLFSSVQETSRKSGHATQQSRHGSPAESLFSHSVSSRSHSPVFSSSKQQPTSPPSSSSNKPWLHPTSRASADRSDPLSPSRAQPRSPSSTNLPPSSLSKTRTVPGSFDSRSSKTRPVLNPSAFLCSSPNALLDGGGQSGSSGGSASQYAVGSITSSLFPESPTTHRLSHLSSTGLSEEDKLRLSLERWNLDYDGILRGGLTSISSALTPKASTSDLYDPHSQAQDVGISERMLAKPLVLSPSPLQKYNLTKNPSHHLESSAFSAASTCLPSLVNPNRAAMQSRYPAESLDKSPSSLARIRALDLDSSTSISSSSPALILNSVVLSPNQSPSSDGSTPRFNSGSISSPNLGTPGSSNLAGIVVSRANSMKESRNPSVIQVPVARVSSLCRRGFTEDDQAPAPKLLGSLFSPVSRQPSIRPQTTTSQPVSRTTSAETAPSIIDHLAGLTCEDDDSGPESSRLPPSIRLVSTSSEPNPPNSVLTANRPPISVITQPHSRPSAFNNRADPSPFSMSTGRASPTIRTQSNKAGSVRRGNPGLGIKPTMEPDRSPKQHVPQLQRRDLDKSQSTKYGSATDDHRAPRNHQSSPNLRSLRPSTPPDSSFFSVIVSGPQHSGLDSKVMSQAERDILEAHCQSHSLPGSTSSSNPGDPDKPNSPSSNSRHLLIVPGMTPEANALRLAELFWQEDESIIKRRKLTEWLGSPETAQNQLQVLTRRAFMDKFDFKNLRIDLAFRKLCTKMYLKGETQQVDRILAEFSRRYWEQNQSHIYVNADMVHAMTYSILLLNTDLHIVDTTTRMSRSQFIRNTMETIQAQLSTFEPLSSSRSKSSSAEPPRPSTATPEAVRTNLRASSHGSMTSRNRRTSFVDLSRVLPASSTLSQSATRPSMERWRDVLRTGSQPSVKTPHRSHSITSWPSEDEIQSRGGVCSPPPGSAGTDHERHPSIDTMTSYSPAANRIDEHSSTSPLNSAENGSPAPKTNGVSKALFDKEIETLLKEIYMAIKSQPIAQIAVSHSQEPGPYDSLQRMTSRRSTQSHGYADTIGPHKRASLRGFGGLAGMLNAAPDLPGARSSSPTPSASTSVSSLPSGMMGYSSNAGSSLNLTNLTTPSIGFVSNLSQSIIREQHEEESLESSQIEDEQSRDSELALLGAPWAKEGILQRKQYWESKGKRHKDRGWAQVFVVIQTGVLKMFQFGNSGGSSGGMGGGAGAGGGEIGATTTTDSDGVSGVGGGNWLPNAQLLGAITLSHALTSVLVSGYSKDRPHVFVLTLSNGASYFFQAGTEELVYEWVSTCNYWAARLSKEPLTGGVSNMEYGWNQLLDTDLASTSEKKEELRECHTDREEMMSIVSGHSGHSHTGLRLRDRLFSSLPLGSPLSPPLIHQANRTSDVEHWSHSATSTDTPNSPHTDSKAASTLNLDRPAHQPSVPEKLTISDWVPPVPPMALSSHPEHVQLESLKRHNSHIQVELEKHNLLRRPMVNLYWNRPTHLHKAMTNWEKKSQYLMAEIIKYTTYLNALESTIKLKLSLSKATSSASH